MQHLSLTQRRPRNLEWKFLEVRKYLIFCKPFREFAHALYRLHVFYSWIERSIRSIFNGFLLKMLLRSLSVYILKQSISVNSSRIFTSPLCGSVNILPLLYSPRFQRIITGAQPKAGTGHKMQTVSVVFSTLHCLGYTASSETQRLLAETMQYFWAKVYFKCWIAPGNLFLPNQFQKRSNSVPLIGQKNNFFCSISEELWPGNSVAFLHEAVFFIDRPSCLARTTGRLSWRVSEKNIQRKRGNRKP